MDQTVPIKCTAVRLSETATDFFAKLGITGIPPYDEENENFIAFSETGDVYIVDKIQQSFPASFLMPHFLFMSYYDDVMVTPAPPTE